jgi:hypothetical protein
MAEETPIYFNPRDPAFRANPYPHYGPLLAGPPRVVDRGAFKIALVARYADVICVLHDHEHFSSMGPPPPPERTRAGLPARTTCSTPILPSIRSFAASSRATSRRVVFAS